jgi:hypothetical protein
MAARLSRSRSCEDICTGAVDLVARQGAAGDAFIVISEVYSIFPLVSSFGSFFFFIFSFLLKITFRSSSLFRRLAVGQWGLAGMAGIGVRRTYCQVVKRHSYC